MEKSFWECLSFLINFQSHLLERYFVITCQFPIAVSLEQNQNRVAASVIVKIATDDNMLALMKDVRFAECSECTYESNQSKVLLSLDSVGVQLKP